MSNHSIQNTAYQKHNSVFHLNIDFVPVAGQLPDRTLNVSTDHIQPVIL